MKERLQRGGRVCRPIPAECAEAPLARRQLGSEACGGAEPGPAPPATLTALREPTTGPAAPAPQRTVAGRKPPPAGGSGQGPASRPLGQTGRHTCSGLRQQLRHDATSASLPQEPRGTRTVNQSSSCGWLGCLKPPPSGGAEVASLTKQETSLSLSLLPLGNPQGPGYSRGIYFNHLNVDK